MYCLPKYLADKFLEALKRGTVTPDKLTDMTSAERRAFFTEMLGEEHAVQVNSLFESKLLLKDQQRGIITWAKQTAGISKQAQRDIISRVDKMTEILNPATQDAFLEDIVAHKLDVTVTMEQAANISSLGKIALDKKIIMEASERRLTGQRQTPTEKEYGDARVAFSNYISDLKTKAKQKSVYEYLRMPRTAFSELAGLAKASKASLDNSAILRQGLKVLWTHPTIWLKNSANTFVDIWKTLGGENVMDEINSDIVSRPTYDNMIKDKLAVGVMEEAYPTHLPSKIPVLGKLFKASEAAYTGFMYRNRADLYDLYTEIAIKSGLPTTTDLGIGRLVNSLTSRGNVGRLEPIASTLNNVFFAPRNLKANFDILMAHTFDKNLSPFVRKQAAINLVKIISGTAAILVIAKAIDPDSVEVDPRSANFGKIRVGDTRFDVTGGMAGIVTLASRLIVTLASRLITMKSKSSITGKTVDLWSRKYGAQTGKDVVYDFFENKFSPAAQLAKNILEGSDYRGNKITFTGELNTFITPLPVTTYQELANNPNSANIILSMIFEELGVSTNTYSKKKKGSNVIKQPKTKSD
ncbi:MAG: hypothetical protein PHG53_09575 [Phycisphaerae bacterium]|nr:hypothetical protein [Phycisphaerae bacterium]